MHLMDKIAPKHNERQWAAGCHLAAFLGFVILPIGTILGPLTVWLLKRQGMPLVDIAGRQSLNFQITLLILTLIAFSFTLWGFGWAFFGVILINLFNVVMVVMAAVKTVNGNQWHYPFAFRFLR